MGTYLVTGIAGGLSQLVAQRLQELGHEVVGVDYRRHKEIVPLRLQVYQANYNKTLIEDVFRRHTFEGVLHLGRVGNLKESATKRFDLNVMGSRKIMDLCLKYEVGRLLVLSTFHIYGANPYNHTPIHEDEPLRAGQTFPQLADAVQLDNQSLTWIYQHPHVRTVMLRPCNVVGPHLSNAMSQFLRLKTVPYLLGFNPMLQFIHELDLRDAIVSAFFGQEPGVFNVAGPGAMPYRTALAIAGARQVPLTEPMVWIYLRVTGLFGPSFPPYLVDFFKYACVISDESFRQAFRWEPKVGMAETIENAVRGTEVPAQAAAAQ
jgi:UDP-glucose 4-epimerase